MKKILFSIIALLGVITADAQSVKVYKNGSFLEELKNTSEKKYEVVYEDVVAPEYVDLGLPSGTLWATFNIGATKPTEYGELISWGETDGDLGGKIIYGWPNYKHCDGTRTSLNKYCFESDYGTIDKKKLLDAEDDAATVRWGSDWCVPSYEQWEELMKNANTTKTKKQIDGVWGMEVVSKTNGKSIFLPYAGEYRTSGKKTTLDYRDERGSYWTNENYYLSGSLNSALAPLLSLYNMSSFSEVYRNQGSSIRPVRYVKPTSLTLSTPYTGIVKGKWIKLKVTSTPVKVSYKAIEWTSSDESVATVDMYGVVRAVSEGTAVITAKHHRENIKATCTVTVFTPEYVDLGLPSGTLWATHNVGASKPEEYGDYFAWGETKGYLSGKTNFDWSTYKYCKGTENTLTKYNTNSALGVVDGKIALDPEDDAATANWGPDWCMPTSDQITELFFSDYTTAKMTLQNGIVGYKIASKSNGHYLFLPAAGVRHDTTLEILFNGAYWSQIYWDEYNAGMFDISQYGWDNKPRCYGLTIRPVRKK